MIGPYLPWRWASMRRARTAVDQVEIRFRAQQGFLLHDARQLIAETPAGPLGAVRLDAVIKEVEALGSFHQLLAGPALDELRDARARP
jgi:hypothetical protein